MGTMIISLNGTDINPFHRLGLRQNPFPQIARYEIDKQVMLVQSLGAEPIPDTDYIRLRLAGRVSQELIDLCCAQFVKGKNVKFTIHWPDDPRTDS